MRKKIKEETFLKIAQKYDEKGLMTCLKERGLVVFRVDNHTFCRAEKNKKNIILHIQPKKGWNLDEERIKKNSFVNALLESCEA